MESGRNLTPRDFTERKLKDWNETTLKDKQTHLEKNGTTFSLKNPGGEKTRGTVQSDWENQKHTNSKQYERTMHQ